MEGFHTLLPCFAALCGCSGDCIAQQFWFRVRMAFAYTKASWASVVLSSLVLEVSSVEILVQA